MTDSDGGKTSAETARVWAIFINDHYKPTFDGLSLTLKQAGFNVMGSSSPEKSLELVKLNNFDCAVLDLDAQDRSMTLADIFMKTSVPFFFLGGFEGEDLGVHGHVRKIKKPASRAELLAEVNKMLKGAGREV